MPNDDNNDDNNELDAFWDYVFFDQTGKPRKPGEAMVQIARIVIRYKKNNAIKQEGLKLESNKKDNPNWSKDSSRFNMAYKQFKDTYKNGVNQPPLNNITDECDLKKCTKNVQKFISMEYNDKIQNKASKKGKKIDKKKLFMGKKGNIELRATNNDFVKFLNKHNANRPDFILPSISNVEKKDGNNAYKNANNIEKEAAKTTVKKAVKSKERRKRGTRTERFLHGTKKVLKSPVRLLKHFKKRSTLKKESSERSNNDDNLNQTLDPKNTMINTDEAERKRKEAEKAAAEERKRKEAETTAEEERKRKEEEEAERKRKEAEKAAAEERKRKEAETTAEEERKRKEEEEAKKKATEEEVTQELNNYLDLLNKASVSIKKIIDLYREFQKFVKGRLNTSGDRFLNKAREQLNEKIKSTKIMKEADYTILEQNKDCIDEGTLYTVKTQSSEYLYKLFNQYDHEIVDLSTKIKNINEYVVVYKKLKEFAESNEKFIGGIVQTKLNKSVDEILKEKELTSDKKLDLEKDIEANICTREPFNEQVLVYTQLYSERNMYDIKSLKSSISEMTRIYEAQDAKQRGVYKKRLKIYLCYMKKYIKDDEKIDVSSYNAQLGKGPDKNVKTVICDVLKLNISPIQKLPHVKKKEFEDEFNYAIGTIDVKEFVSSGMDSDVWFDDVCK